MEKLSRVIDRIRRMTHDEQVLEYTNETIVDYINDGIKFVRRAVMNIYPQLLIDIDTEDILEPEEDTIYLFEPIAQIVDFRIDGRVIPCVNPGSVSDTYELGQPQGYAMENFDTIKIYPAPENPTPYTLKAIKDFEPLTVDSEEIPLTNGLIDFVVEYAIMRASFTNEFDMTQESSLMVSVLQSLEARLRAFTPASVITRGYW